MVNLNDKKIRQELVWRYLNAETTQEEERSLTEFLSNTDIILTDDEEDVLLLLQSSNFIKQSDITTDKADEFDRLMQKGCNKRNRFVRIRWVASAVAAVTGAVLFFSALHIDKAEKEQDVAMVAPSTTEVKPEREDEQASEAQSINTSELLETIHLLSKMETNDVIITASSCSDGFIVMTKKSNEPSSEYLLKRGSDGSSIELTSQSINFYGGF